MDAGSQLCRDGNPHAMALSPHFTTGNVGYSKAFGLELRLGSQLYVFAPPQPSPLPPLAGPQTTNRQGVQTRDLVIGVGEHRASSYGTVLAFMNIMGRPIELRFRKFSSQIAVEGGSRSGGEAIVT